MTRLGWIIAIVFLLIATGFALMVRKGDGNPIVVASAPVASSAPSSSGPGPSGLQIPVAGVQAAMLQDNFNQPRDEGVRAHGALDIMAPRGTPVLAASPGVVEKLFESQAGGHTVYVRSDDGGWVYYYAHLDTVLPGTAEGTHVERGQPIATVGSTGNADPGAPHLHFEVKRMAPGKKWYEGQGMDPYPLLVAG